MRGLTICFLAIGKSLIPGWEYQFWISRRAISYIVMEVFQALYEVMSSKHLADICWYFVALMLNNKSRYPVAIGHFFRVVLPPEISFQFPLNPLGFLQNNKNMCWLETCGHYLPPRPAYKKISLGGGRGLRDLVIGDHVVNINQQKRLL